MDASFTGTWSLTSAPLEGARRTLVTPLNLTLPAASPGGTIWIWVTRHAVGDREAPKKIPLTIQAAPEGILRAENTLDGVRYRFAARLVAWPPDSGDFLLQGFFDRQEEGSGTGPGEDTESFTGVRTGGAGGDPDGPRSS